jgi:hypothetical protein
MPALVGAETVGPAGHASVGASAMRGGGGGATGDGALGLLLHALQQSSATITNNLNASIIPD